MIKQATFAHTTQRGFTLIELMIVVVIIAIIAAIAYPSYRRSVVKSNRSDAMVALTQAAQSLERCYAQHHNYKNGNCVFNSTSPEGYYKITTPNITTTSYTLQATVKTPGTQADDSHCKTFKLTSAGAKTATSSNCWQ